MGPFLDWQRKVFRSVNKYWWTVLYSRQLVLIAINGSTMRKNT